MKTNSDYYADWSLSRTWHIFQIPDGADRGEDIDSICGSKTTTVRSVNPVEEKKQELKNRGCNKCRKMIENQEPELYREIWGETG